MLRALKPAYFQKFLDIKLATSTEFETHIVERPGVWMQEDQREAVRKDLVEIASRTLDRRSLTYGIFREDGRGLDNCVITIVRNKKTGNPVAFNALALIDVELGKGTTRVLHLGLVMVDPDVRSQGLSWILYGLTCTLFFLRNQLRPIWISNVTQVPAIVGMVAETFSEVFPHPGKNQRRSIKHLLLGREIMKSHRHVFGVGEEAGFDQDRFVVTNAYTGGSDSLKKTYDQAQKHRDEIYNAFCEDKLDYKRGDDVLQLGQINLNTSKDYLLKSVPRGSVRSLIAAGLFVTLQRLALPLVYWFDTSQSWGRLRARKI
jgi:hypothetical protein